MAKRKPDSQDGEDSLARRLRLGDREVLQEILAEFGGAVELALSKRFAPAVNGADLEDAMAVALFRMWQLRDRYDPGKASLQAWLFVLARSATLDLLRKRKLEAQAASVAARTSRELPDDSSSKNALATAVMATIATLSERDQAIVGAWLFSDGTADWTRRVASDWKMTSGNVRVRLNRILKRIRHRLGDHALE